MEGTISDLVAAYIIKDNQLLLVHNVKKERRVEPPGGKVLLGESYEDATIRECKEELGIDVIVDYKVGVYHTHSSEGNFNVHTFSCRINNGEPTLNEPHKFDKVEYYSYEELEILKRVGFLVPNLADNIAHIKEILKNQ